MISMDTGCGGVLTSPQPAFSEMHLLAGDVSRSAERQASRQGQLEDSVVVDDRLGPKIGGRIEQLCESSCASATCQAINSVPAGFEPLFFPGLLLTPIWRLSNSCCFVEFVL
ncbi:MAG: hypothetical protein E5W38_16680 [Mesorhizobium sp.]|nr:MAG: hypothetical protein E5W38_16680 [Mesorhizobium sp.]